MKVYFIQSGGDRGPVKVGKSRDVDVRLKELQVGNPEELEIKIVLVANSEKHALHMEKRFHRRFKKYHIRGEWFKCNVLKITLGNSSSEIVNRMEVGREVDIL